MIFKIQFTSMNLRYLTLAFAALLSLASAADIPVAAARSTQPETILFVGNSFMFGAGSAARYYRAETVTDLNDEK
jgi:hypothetical protein